MAAVVNKSTGQTGIAAFYVRPQPKQQSLWVEPQWNYCSSNKWQCITGELMALSWTTQDRLAIQCVPKFNAVSKLQASRQVVCDMTCVTHCLAINGDARRHKRHWACGQHDVLCCHLPTNIHSPRKIVLDCVRCSQLCRPYQDILKCQKSSACISLIVFSYSLAMSKSVKIWLDSQVIRMYWMAYHTKSFKGSL